MGVLNRTTDEINTLLDKIANLPEEGMGGKDGKTPVFETGTTTTLEAGLQATSEVVRNGEDVSGNPKYKINFGIPQGMPGSGSGGGVADSIDWKNVTNKPTWVQSATKPSYTATEVGALPTSTIIPSKTSQLTNDSGFVKNTGLKTINGESIVGEGNIEITGSGGGIADAPSDGQVYGRKNNNWSVIQQSGGTNSFVDITELFLRINSLNTGEKANQEDYDTLLEYARNRTNVSAYNSISTTGMFISSLAIFTTSDSLFIHFISYLYGIATPQVNLISISSALEIQKMSYLYQDAIMLDGYKPATKYTPIEISDSISVAFGKLEAGVKQSISGENNVYILPIELYHLRNESTSEQISTAIGGDEGFNNIVAAIKSFKRFYFKMNEEMICEVAMTYFSAGENNKAIVMRVSSSGAFNQYAGIISVGTITKENSTYTFEALALQSQA